MIIMWKFIFLLFVLSGNALADVYMHNPRGSNNRNEEQDRERDNANRLFDSQNNERGGYNSGSLSEVKPMQYMVGSMLPIEWTNQHGCGTEGANSLHNTHCELVIQYMCSPLLRDGTRTDTIRENAASNNDQSYGMHEDYQYYKDCTDRQRNKGLFTADQDLKGDKAINTRQNPDGTRNGFECPEERDYYPYWGPSPWKDIAVLTNNVSRCPLYKKDSPNVDCKKAPLSRDNHNGNGLGGFPNYYNWTIPNDGIGQKCALRLRYNISTSEMDWDTDKSMNALNEDNNNDDSPNLQNPTKIDIGKKMGLTPITSLFGGYRLKQNPQVHPFYNVPNLDLALAVNTAQYGRTFQDRSHAFEIVPRPAGVPAAAQIHNLNVRGKRGNIVQVYPAVEYDFVPNRLEMKQNDYVHIQWTGSNKNPNENDGEGKKGTDRSNMVLLQPQLFSEGTPGRAVPVDLKMGQFGSSIPDCLCNSSFLGLGETTRDMLALSNTESKKVGNKLDNASPYFNLPLQKVSAKPGTTYHYMSTRNNNFSNRSQKGRIVVLPENSGKKDQTEKND